MEHIPFELSEVASGKQVFDWVVPQSWELHSFTLTGPGGEIICSSEDSNLHVVSHSEPFFGQIRGSDLREHCHVLPDMPNAIPYVTAYYKKTWGICMSQDQVSRLEDGETYDVHLDVTKTDGHLVFGEALLPGSSSKEILISSYLCHPSMGNNELSGPLAMVRLYELLKSRDRVFTYRFLIAPETIGSLAFMSEAAPEKLDRIYLAAVLTCLGGPARNLSVKQAKSKWLGKPAEIDYFLEALRDSGALEWREFTPLHGSDERQFSSEGANLTTIQFARTVYGDYEEYHTSLDNLDFMNCKAVEKSALQIYDIFTKFEQVLEVPSSKHLAGEPFLSRYGLYPAINAPSTHYGDNREKFNASIPAKLDAILLLLSLVDSQRSILEIAKLTGAQLGDLLEASKLLQANDVIYFEEIIP